MTIPLNMNRRGFFKMATIASVASVGALSLTPSQAAAAIDVSHKIKISGDLRTYTQRMALATIFVKEDVEKAHFLEVLTKEYDEFESYIAALRAGDAAYQMEPEQNKLVLEAINTVEVGWKVLGPAIKHIIDEGAASEADFKKIEKVNVQVMSLADSLIHRVLLEYKADLPQVLAYQIDVAGAQRTISQKMIKEGILVAMGFDVEAHHTMLMGSMSLFEFGLDKLNGKMLHNEVMLPTPSDGMKTQLGRADEIWAEIKPCLEKLDNGHKTSTEEAVELSQKADQMFDVFGAISDELLERAAMI